MAGNRGSRQITNRFQGYGNDAQPGPPNWSSDGEPSTGLWRKRISEYWQLVLAVQAQRQAVVDTRALISGERRGDSPHHELSGLYLIPSPPSSHQLRQLLYSRLRLCVLRAQMLLLDESAGHHRNSRHAGVHYKHIP